MADGADIVRTGVVSGVALPLQRVAAAVAGPMSLGAWARELAGRAIVYALFPVVLSQAFALRRHALRLVPAVGPPDGKIGRGEPLHFQPFDAILLSVGVNDVLKLERSARFRRQFSPRPDLFADDGLHPSETGQRMLAKVIAAALTPRFGAAPRPRQAPPA